MKDIATFFDHFTRVMLMRHDGVGLAQSHQSWWFYLAVIFISIPTNMILGATTPVGLTDITQNGMGGHVLTLLIAGLFIYQGPSSAIVTMLMVFCVENILRIALTLVGGPVGTVMTIYFVYEIAMLIRTFKMVNEPALP